VPLERGHAFTITGWEPLPKDPGSERWIANLLDAPPAAKLVIYADPARGTFRYASVMGRRLDSCLFIARKQSALPSRQALAAFLCMRIEPEMRINVLAGGGTAQNAADRTICACFGIGLNTLHDTITSHRLTKVTEIGAYDLPAFKTMDDIDIWKIVGPVGTVYGYPPRADEETSIAGAPARTEVGARIYNQAINTVMVSKFTQGREKPEDTIKWAENELEATLRA
jgi:hypothetical protein